MPDTFKIIYNHFLIISESFEKYFEWYWPLGESAAFYPTHILSRESVCDVRIETDKRTWEDIRLTQKDGIINVFETDAKNLKSVPSALPQPFTPGNRS